MKCCICGKELKRKQSGKVKYPTCGDPYCQKLTRKKYYQENAKKIPKMTETRLAGIEQMRKDLDTKEAFLKAMAGLNGAMRLARQYGIQRADVTAYKKELLAGMKLSEIRQLQQEALMINLPTKQLVTVYKIIDREAFEKGGVGTYNGLKFDRIENPVLISTRFDTEI